MMKKVYAMALKYMNYDADDFSSIVRWTCWGADMRQQSRIESFTVKLYILLDVHLVAID
jgi:hypothetical protein